MNKYSYLLWGINCHDGIYLVFSKIHIYKKIIFIYIYIQSTVEVNQKMFIKVVLRQERIFGFMFFFFYACRLDHMVTKIFFVY